jgi:hypothetical protein
MKSFIKYVQLREESQNLSNVKFGEPTPKQYRVMQKEHPLINIESNDGLLEDPPTNESEDTRAELLELQDRLELEKNKEEMLEKWDTDLTIPFVEYLEKNKLPYDKDSIDKIINDSTVIILKQKYHYNRPRPYQIDKMVGVKINSINSETANSPAYPSGHSTQSKLLALYLSERHRNHSDRFLDLAEECGQSRLNAGVHYPSDHEAGVELAEILFNHMNLQEKKSIKYKRLPAHPGGMEGY